MSDLFYPEGGTPEIYKQGQEDAFAIITAYRTGDKELQRLAMDPIMEDGDVIRIMFCIRALAATVTSWVHSVADSAGRDREELWLQYSREFIGHYFDT